MLSLEYFLLREDLAMFPRLVWYLIHSQGTLNLGSSTFCVLGLWMHKPMFSFSYCNDYVSLDAWHGHLVGKMEIMIKMAIVVSSWLSIR